MEALKNPLNMECLYLIPIVKARCLNIRNFNLRGNSEAQKLDALEVLNPLYHVHPLIKSHFLHVTHSLKTNNDGNDGFSYLKCQVPGMKTPFTHVTPFR